MAALEICVIATKRSGHHAFIEWILAHRVGSYAYFNDVRAGAPISRAAVFVSNIDGLAPDDVAQRDDLETCVFSYENEFLQDILAPPFAERASVLGKSRRRVAVLMVRDPLNAFASVAKVVELFPDSRSDHGAWFGAFSRAWKDHAREMLGRTAWLDTDYAPEDRLVVSFNSYIRDQSYASRIAQNLDMADASRLNHLSSFGTGGRTFFADWNSFSPDVDILESRWRQLKSPDVFRHVLGDSEFVELAGAYYRSVGLADEFLPILDSLCSRFA